MSRLQAPDPTWQVRADVVVVGSGVAGLTCALHARRAGLRVLLVTKGSVDEGSTRWAQGGIAAALAEDDSPREHLHDTLIAGDGLCDEAAVDLLVNEGPAAVHRLISLGAHFDVDAAGELVLTREGGHLRDRITHAGGDATGVEISRALVSAVQADPGIELIERALALDLLTDKDGAAQGLTLHVIGTGTRDGVGAALAPTVVLATGGFGQVFSQTTNPSVATGDGLALAIRAGAEIADVEFVQFHPTVMWLGAAARGQQPLVSEAVRGEGAVLRDTAGQTFRAAEHPLADLAPRDVVSRAIMRRMLADDVPHLWLDAREFGADKWQERFPTIYASCFEHGIDPVRELIPVAPAAHYVSGGVRTDLQGRTSIRGLYACGEVACTGVHGANRLASNSLLEGLVFAERIGQSLADRRDQVRAVVPDHAVVELLPLAARAEVQMIMTTNAGVLRGSRSLTKAAQELHLLADRAGGQPSTADWESTNVCLVAQALVHHALLREETRGSHWREDFPARDDAHWRIHLVSAYTPQRQWDTRRENLTPMLAEPVAAMLVDAGLDPTAVGDLISMALAEDLAGGVDVTSVATVPIEQRSRLRLVAREAGIVAGGPVAAMVFVIAASGSVDVQIDRNDGQAVDAGDVIMTATGTTRDLLLAERTALNLVSHLSGIATHTRKWVEAIEGSAAKVRDTRKTMPGMRALQKYAVRCGGGVNHRMSLSDAALVKDNHVVAAGGVVPAFAAVRQQFPGVPIEVEVDSLDQLEAVVEAGADLVLLDNFTVADTAIAVERTGGRARLESSGGLRLDNAAEVAATGVDYLAVGALTHSSAVLDIGADLEEVS